MRQIYIFRHGITDWNQQHRVQGHSDIALNKKGKLQALELQKKLARCELDICLASNLLRAKETAKIACSQTPIKYYFELREAFLGEAEGMTLSEVQEHFGELFWDISNYQQHNFWQFRYPGGESRQEAVDRFSKIIDQYSHLKNLAISTHGGILRLFILFEVLRSGLDLLDIPIPNCALYRLEYSDHLCTCYQLC